ncbi:hypothetical protein C3432_16055 [Citrobacter amalonaticus]|nr:hypothetical protein C3432_16055 [Citrobacter amalonaticus]
MRGLSAGEHPHVTNVTGLNGIDRNTVMKMTGMTEDELAQILHYSFPDTSCPAIRDSKLSDSESDFMPQ